ncbi:uncharacterized protein BT62DRAFT_999134 [Guyanagaster necrorhizus]|uniref:Uncharacterized protein n=1 Tax=Guyanagaster necrorhizus TaxID=856835 RepID=A0A9P7W6K3_9AGAR|nr:uncharacterized protein BT62DRAFT_999134 [Guyanagaster necrorhizus MCA 3950]KAG7453102.1 hypothetical protein BT62DRAFT_999134 [Guyanagaster necrorhizus MCA 3950]
MLTLNYYIRQLPDIISASVHAHIGNGQIPNTDVVLPFAFAFVIMVLMTFQALCALVLLSRSILAIPVTPTTNYSASTLPLPTIQTRCLSLHDWLRTRLYHLLS